MNAGHGQTSQFSGWWKNEWTVNQCVEHESVTCFTTVQQVINGGTPICICIKLHHHRSWYMLTDSTVAWWYAIIMKRIGTIINKDYVLLHLLHTVSTYQPIGMQTLWGMHLLISKAWDIRALQAQEPNSCVPWKLCLWLSWTNLLPKTFLVG